MTTVVKQLHAFIDRNGLTQGAAACVMHTGIRTMRRWLAGDTVPPGSVDLLLKLFADYPALEKECVRKYAA